MEINISNHKGDEKHLVWLLPNITTTPSDIETRSGWVLGIIGNEITWISNRAINITECDLEAQLRGVRIFNFRSSSVLIFQSNQTIRSHLERLYIVLYTLIHIGLC